jgi:hypothetical protein
LPDSLFGARVACRQGRSMGRVPALDNLEEYAYTS